MTSTNTVGNETSISIKDIIEMKKMLKEKYPKPLETILVTNRPIIPHGEAWMKEYKGKKYIMMGYGSFMQIQEFLEKSIQGCGYSYGIPVIEDDELMVKIIAEAFKGGKQ